MRVPAPSPAKAGEGRVQPQTPEGWVLVPREPTDDMLNAAQERLCELRNITDFDDHLFAEMFKAAVSTSPSQAEPGDGSGTQTSEPSS